MDALLIAGLLSASVNVATELVPDEWRRFSFWRDDKPFPIPDTERGREAGLWLIRHGTDRRLCRARVAAIDVHNDFGC